MNVAYRMQNFQDWFTQQWVIWWGRKINPVDYPWLIGPFGSLNGIGADFIQQLMEKENLVFNAEKETSGILPSIVVLGLGKCEIARLSDEVIQFYENTSQYDLHFNVKWNPLFKGFGRLVNDLFSNRINQLNIPTKNGSSAEKIESEIISLIDPATNEVKYTVWRRSIPATGQVIYLGIYGVCQLPSGKIAVKAVFPLPKGNATVIMHPMVGEEGQLILDSAGEQFGDAGFYFLLQDEKGQCWSQFVRSFRDRLVINSTQDQLHATQVLSLWKQKVLQFHYKIEKKFPQSK